MTIANFDYFQPISKRNKALNAEGRLYVQKPSLSDSVASPALIQPFLVNKGQSDRQSASSSGLHQRRLALQKGIASGRFSTDFADKITAIASKRFAPQAYFTPQFSASSPSAVAAPHINHSSKKTKTALSKVLFETVDSFVLRPTGQLITALHNQSRALVSSRAAFNLAQTCKPLNLLYCVRYYHKVLIAAAVASFALGVFAAQLQSGKAVDVTTLFSPSQNTMQTSTPSQFISPAFNATSLDFSVSNFHNKAVVQQKNQAQQDFVNRGVVPVSLPLGKPNRTKVQG